VFTLEKNMARFAATSVSLKIAASPRAISCSARCTDFAIAGKDRLYRCLDRLLEHKDALFKHLKQRWEDLFGAEFDVLLYDLTSTY